MSLDEKDIELMLQQHTRHCAEQRMLDDMRAHYGSYLRRANRRHYAIVACVALLLMPALWVATPSSRRRPPATAPSPPTAKLSPPPTK